MPFLVAFISFLSSAVCMWEVRHSQRDFMAHSVHSSEISPRMAKDRDVMVRSCVLHKPRNLLTNGHRYEI